MCMETLMSQFTGVYNDHCVQRGHSVSLVNICKIYYWSCFVLAQYILQVDHILVILLQARTKVLAGLLFSTACVNTEQHFSNGIILHLPQDVLWCYDM